MNVAYNLPDDVDPHHPNFEDDGEDDDGYTSQDALDDAADLAYDNRGFL